MGVGVSIFNDTQYPLFVKITLLISKTIKVGGGERQIENFETITFKDNGLITLNQ